MWQKIKLLYHQLGSPPTFYRISGKIAPWLLWSGILLGAWGLYEALFVVPPDYQQGNSYRILFIHVPVAWMSMFVYVFMAVAGVVGMVWRMKVAEICAMAAAPIGAAFTAVTLLTGSLWGKPTWGAWWTWDARLTSELVLLFLYLGTMALYRAIDDRRQAARAASFWTVVGVINIPIIHYSVEWWSTLHQGSTIRLIGESSMDSSMILPLIVLTLATKLYFGAALIYRARTLIIESERRKNWVRELLLPAESNYGNLEKTT